MVVSYASRCAGRGGGKVDLAWFITPHGFGHAARASAVIAACSERVAGLRHHLFTTVPAEFFVESLRDIDWRLLDHQCDVGMIQCDPFSENVEETVRALDGLSSSGGPKFHAVIAAAARTECRIVVCDIAPLGLVVADRLEVPGILLENFTWDWIYRAYGDRRLDAHGDRLSVLFDSADLRIQTEPVCRPKDDARVVPPVSRSRRMSRAEVRTTLGIPHDHRMVLLSVSGMESRALDDPGFESPPNTTLVAPGLRHTPGRRRDVVRTEVFGGPYHPDLVAASDLVVGKLGYSTVAEVFHARTAFAYLDRPRFPESPILEDFVRRHIPSAPLPSNWLEDPATTGVLEGLLGVPQPPGPRPNGADKAAELMLELL